MIFSSKETGMALPEYALMFVLVSIVLLVALSLLGIAIDDTFQNIVSYFS